MSISITPAQVSYKKQVGKLDGADVYEVGLIGGLHLVMKAGDKAPLGVGPHPAVARHIAKKKNKGIVFTELTKSEDLDPKLFQDVLPRYEQLTAEFDRVSED
jgi:hypothetical protein